MGEFTICSAIEPGPPLSLASWGQPGKFTPYSSPPKMVSGFSHPRLDTCAMKLAGVASVTELRDWFNDRELGSYDGVAWRCWIARGDEVRAVEVTAKRLLW